MNTKIIKRAGMAILALGVVFALGACSSKPSPWSQQASPWDNRQSDEGELSQDMASADESPFVNDAAETESSGLEEPDSLEEGAAFVEPEPMMEEPMMEEAMGEEADAMAEPEPMMQGAVTGGNISSQPPGYYAVQVVASSNMGNLKAFANRHQLSDEWVAETIVNGKTWFVLLQGIYPTMDEAKRALDQARVNLDTSPWVRSVGSLQAVMMQ